MRTINRPESLQPTISQSSSMQDEPTNNDAVPRQQHAARFMTNLRDKIPCCSRTDPSNPCMPRTIGQSGYWLLISSVLLAFAMLIPLLKGLQHMISAYINLLLFAMIFLFGRKPDAMAVMAASAVVIAHSFFGIAMFIFYASPYGSCEPLLLIGVRSSRNSQFCHDLSFMTISLICGFVWMIIAGCLFRFVELRRKEIVRQTTALTRPLRPPVTA